MMTETGPSGSITEVSHAYDKEEFLKVYKHLFAESFSLKQWALNRIDVWKQDTRCPALPTAIDATANLVNVVIHDEYFKLGLPDGYVEVTYDYSWELNKFVRFLTEYAQKNDYPYSIHILTRQLGFPDFIGRQIYPSPDRCISIISTLRDSAKIALKFLDEKYWRKICYSFNDFVPENDSHEAKIVSSIAGFLDCRCALLRLPVYKSKEKLNSKLNFILNEVQNLLEKSSNKFFDVFIQPEHFLYSLEDMRKLFPKDFKLLINQRGSLPSFMETLWEPMIDVINSKHKVEEFVLKLLVKQKNMDLIHQRMACAWAWKLISIVLNDDSLDISNPIVKIYQAKKWSFDWRILISVCAFNSSKYMSAILLPIIDLPYPAISEEQKNSLIGTFAMYSKEVPQMMKRKEMRSSTWEDLRLDIEWHHSMDFLHNKNKRVKTSV